MCHWVLIENGIQKEKHYKKKKKGNRKIAATTLTQKTQTVRAIKMPASGAQNQLLALPNKPISETHSFVILPVAPKQDFLY